MSAAMTDDGEGSPAVGVRGEQIFRVKKIPFTGTVGDDRRKRDRSICMYVLLLDIFTFPIKHSDPYLCHKSCDLMLVTHSW
jgi:hypothetical protein